MKYIVPLCPVRVCEVWGFFCDSQLLRHECQDVLMGSSGKNSRLVTEMQSPSKQAAPVCVAVVVVVNDTRKPQRHVPKEGCVLHHMGVSFLDLVVQGERVVGLHVRRHQHLSRVLQHLEESFEHDVNNLVLLIDVVELHQILQRVQLVFPFGLKQTLVDLQVGVLSGSVQVCLC